MASGSSQPRAARVGGERVEVEDTAEPHRDLATSRSQCTQLETMLAEMDARVVGQPHVRK